MWSFSMKDFQSKRNRLRSVAFFFAALPHDACARHLDHCNTFDLWRRHCSASQVVHAAPRWAINNQWGLTRAGRGSVSLPGAGSLLKDYCKMTYEICDMIMWNFRENRSSTRGQSTCTRRPCTTPCYWDAWETLELNRVTGWNTDFSTRVHLPQPGNWVQGKIPSWCGNIGHNTPRGADALFNQYKL